MHKKPPQDKTTSARIEAPARRSQRTDFSPKSGKPASINELLARRTVLHKLSSVIPVQQAWADWLRSQLDPALAPHVASVVPKQDELVVFADSAAWSGRLRYAVAALQESITARDGALTRATVRVQMKTAISPRGTPRE